MSIEYFFNDPFFINTETQLYSQYGNILDTNIYDYIITLNTTFDNLFNVKSYKQSDQDTNNVEINFSIHTDEYNNIYNQTFMSPTETNAYIYGSMDKIDFNTRILEILALKIFGHAKARSAIGNDTNIINNLKNELLNHFDDTIQRHKHDIFNMYVYQDKQDLTQDDVSKSANFNFNYDKIAFPGYVRGSLSRKNLLSASLLNGPTHGINSVVNGDYNIPILIMFSDETMMNININNNNNNGNNNNYNINNNNNNNNNQPPNYNYTIILMTYDDNGYVTYIAFDATSIYQ